MKTLCFTLIAIGAFLALMFIAVWLEARVRLRDFWFMIAAAVTALVVWVVAYHLIQP